MEREIRFRGKTFNNNDWVYGYYTKGCGTFAEDTPVIETGECDFHVWEETVGQFTGLKDKKGKEIYEGDIVSYNEFYEGDFKTPSGIGYVRWDEEGHSVCTWSDEEMYICSVWDAAKNFGGIVIGNIHDNKDLLID